MGIVLLIIAAIAIGIWLVNVWNEQAARDKEAKITGWRSINEQRMPYYYKKSDLSDDEIIKDFLSRERDSDCSTD